MMRDTGIEYRNDAGKASAVFSWTARDGAHE